MKIKDFFNASKIKAENEQLIAINSALSKQISDLGVTEYTQARVLFCTLDDANLVRLNDGVSAIQQAHTGKSLYHKDIAVVITNMYFTQQAINEASALGVKLWDRNTLTNMISNAEIR